MNVPLFSEERASIKLNVTALKFSNNKLFAGIGNDCLVFTYSENSFNLLCKKTVHIQTIIHGICPNKNNSLVVLFGGKRVTVITLIESKIIDLSVLKSWTVNDWIWDVRWMKDETFLTTLSGHNVLSLWDWQNAKQSATAICQEKCILYSAQVLGDTWQELVVLSGTVFREVVIWIAKGEKDKEKCVLHRLQGHNGVIFSVNYDSKSKRIASTSDDRTVRIWSVKFQSTGSLEDWEEASIDLLFTIFGHTSRVWRSQILTDRKIISIGEDSMLCAWTEEGQPVWQHESHQGGGIWSVDCSEQLKLVATGGADGGISLWPLDFPTITPKSLPLPSDIPRKIGLLMDGTIVIVTDNGYLMVFVKDQWRIDFHDKKIASYCLLEVSLNKRFIALATMSGEVIIFKGSEQYKTLEKITETQIIEGKIFSLNWLENESFIVCGYSGNLTLWTLRIDGFPEKMTDLTLPYCKERWLTSALLHNSTLICGDRDGSLHVYNLENDSSKSLTVCQTFRRIHGNLGVSSLQWLDNTVWSTGRDGNLRKFRFVNNTLHSTTVDKLCLEWIANILESKEFGILVLGFHKNSFIIWSVNERRILIKVLCGGGHRSWACSLDAETLYFTYLKDKTAHNFCCRLRDITRPLLVDGHHIREINSLVKIPVSPSLGTWLASGGEDTTLRVTQLADNELKSINIIRSHLSSVRVVHVYSLDSNTALLFTAGGRAQIKVWKCVIDSSVTLPFVTTVELASEMLREEKKSKPWRTAKPINTPETRFMDLEVVKYTENSLLVLVACSDTFLRLFLFDMDGSKLKLHRSLWYSYHCLLKVGSLKWPENTQVTFSAATDGKLAFWDLADINAVQKPFFILPLHQSGINAYDTRALTRDTVLIATGGDDNRLSVCCVRKIYTNCASAELLSRWSESFYHSSQITGIKITASYIVSTGTDQRIILTKWSAETDGLKFARIAEYISAIPDIHGLEIWPQGCNLALCVYGAGIQVLPVKLDSESNNSTSVTL